MRVRTAQKIVNQASKGLGKPGIGKLYRALRTIWHRSRHSKEIVNAGDRMGGSVNNKTVRAVANVLNKMGGGREY